MIKNEYRVTWELYREWLMENKTRGAKLCFLIFWSFLTIVSIVLYFLEDFFLPFLLLAALGVYRAFIRDYIAARKQYIQLAKLHGCESWRRTITVTDADIVIDEGASVVNCKKSDVVGIRKKGDKIWLIMNNRTVIRLYRSAFAEGSFEELSKEFSREFCEVKGKKPRQNGMPKTRCSR